MSSIFHINISVDPCVFPQPLHRFQKFKFSVITHSIIHQHANFYEIKILNDNVVERRT
jgi:hypothetical protein